MPTRVASSAMASCACFLVPTNRIDAAVGDGLLDELVGLVDVGQRLLQVDDVDAVALGEDEPLHLRVPATGLVPEVDAAVEQLLHGDDSHGRCSLSVRARPAGPRSSVVAGAGRRHRPGVAPEPGPVGHARRRAADRPGSAGPPGHRPAGRPGPEPDGIRGRAKSPRRSRCDVEHTPRTPRALCRIPAPTGSCPHAATARPQLRLTAFRRPPPAATVRAWTDGDGAGPASDGRAAGRAAVPHGRGGGRLLTRRRSACSSRCVGARRAGGGRDGVGRAAGRRRRTEPTQRRRSPAPAPGTGGRSDRAGPARSRAVPGADAPLRPGPRGVDLAAPVGAAGARRRRGHGRVRRRAGRPRGGVGAARRRAAHHLRAGGPGRRGRDDRSARAPSSARSPPATGLPGRPACTGGCAAERGSYLDPLLLLVPPHVRLLPVPDPWPGSRPGRAAAAVGTLPRRGARRASRGAPRAGRAAGRSCDSVTPEDAADLRQRAVLQVVQAHHQPVALAELRDRLPELPTGLALLRRRLAGSGRRRRACRDAAVGARPQLLDAEHGLGAGGAQLAQRPDLQRVGHLALGRGPPQAHASCSPDALGLAGAQPDGARAPSPARAARRGPRPGCAARRSSRTARSGPGRTARWPRAARTPRTARGRPRRHGRAAARGAVHDGAHQRAVVHDQPVAGAPIRRGAVGRPQRPRGVDGGSRRWRRGPPRGAGVGPRPRDGGHRQRSGTADSSGRGAVSGQVTPGDGPGHGPPSAARR